MKYRVFLMSVLAFASLAATAHAESRISNLLDATQRDYETINVDMHGAGGGSAVDARKLKAAADRITARRAAIDNLRRLGLKVLPRDQRGLFRLLVRNLDQINLALLALIGNGKGAAYGMNHTGGTVSWQKGIGMMLDDTRRCLYMVGKVSGPFVMKAPLAPVQAH